MPRLPMLRIPDSRINVLCELPADGKLRLECLLPADGRPRGPGSRRVEVGA